MTYRKLEKEKWLQSYDRTCLDEEVDPKNLYKLIYFAYKHSAMVGNANRNLKLKERFDNLQYSVRSVKNITGIYFIKNAKMYARSASENYDDFIVVEVNKQQEIIVSTSSGEDISYKDCSSLTTYKGITKVKTLYEFNDNDIQYDLDICLMKNITLYKNAELHNSFNNKLISKSDFIELEDYNGNKFYLDIIYNHIYKRENNYNLVILDNTTKHFIFQDRVDIKFNDALFKNVKLKMANIKE